MENQPSSLEPSETADLMTPREVCQAFSIATSTLSLWARTGRIPSVTLPSGHRRYRRSDVERIVQAVNQ